MAKRYLNLKEKYDWTCWKCGSTKNYAKPSIFMSAFQMNTGGGQCPECKSMMVLRIDDQNERMISLEQTPENIKCEQLPDACFASLKVVKAAIAERERRAKEEKAIDDNPYFSDETKKIKKAEIV